MWMGALRFYTRNLVVWVVLCGILAYIFPGPVAQLAGGMNWFFALTMFGIGVVLSPTDFRRITRQPLLVLIGTLAQFTIMPLTAFLVGKALGLPQIYLVGLILTGAAPGAMTSNVMSYLAKADTAYSVSLTTVSTLLCPLLTPGVVYLLAGTTMNVPFWSMTMNLGLTVVAPVLVGVVTRYMLGSRVEKVVDVFPAISTTFIVFICSVVIATNQERLPGLKMFFSEQASEPAYQFVLTIPAIVLTILLADILLNVIGLGGGYAVGALFRMTRDRRRTLSIEVGMQNAGLGVKLAHEYFGPGATLPSVFFVFLCIITASLLATYWQRRTPEDAPPAER